MELLWCRQDQKRQKTEVTVDVIQVHFLTKQYLGIDEDLEEEEDE